MLPESRSQDLRAQTKYVAQLDTIGSCIILFLIQRSLSNQNPFKDAPGFQKSLAVDPPKYLYYGQKIRTPALPSKSSTTFRLYWGAHHVANFLAHPDHCIAPATVPPWLPLNFKAPNFRLNMGHILTNWFTLVYGLHLIYLITS